jgi:ABC-type polysaccharide/polyol phosphate transport system ATPase subunit
MIEVVGGARELAGESHQSVRQTVLRAASAPRDTARAPVIECRAVTKRFYRYEHRTRTMREFFIRSVLRRPVHVRHAEFTLQDFELRVYQGDSVALVGANGSGKSTALRLIAGIYTPTKGKVATRGRVSAIIDLGIGFHPELTGVQNIAQYAAIVGLSDRETAGRVDEIVEFAGIGEFAREPIKYYSSGMHARLTFATAALCVRPDILLVDEVLAVGDQAFQEKCMQHLHRFRQAGGTLVVVSHAESTVREMCERAVWLDRGCVRMSGRTADVLDAYSGAAARAALPAAM